MRWFKWFGRTFTKKPTDVPCPQPIIWEMSDRSMYDFERRAAQRKNDTIMSRLYKGDKTICKHGLFRKECKLCEKKLGFM